MELGAAIIGCGAISPLHAKAISAMKGVQLRVVVDVDAAKAEQAARECGCSRVVDYRELLDRPDIDVVHLCTPHHLHAEMAIECLNAGKHVLTEKPIASDLPSAKRMVEAAENSTGQLGVVFQNRYNEPSIRIKEALDSGELGQLICMKGIVTWHRDESYYTNSTWRGRWDTEGGGVLINQTIHTLDLLQWFGGEISSVKGSITTDALNGIIEVEDTAHATLFFKNNVRALFYATNAYLVNSPVELELVFEQGTLIQRRDCLYLYKKGKETLWSHPPTGNALGKSYWGVSHSLLIKDFYEHVRDKRDFWLNGTEGMKALQLVSDIYTSSSARLTNL
ncbi:Gfo/Idh/MocA family protein [Paenibacillus wynnii]|uniref:Oxidoreductase n=1 Tax=Paenibacillus wynnii TaxID=268407 RepID=A0A098M3M7_9BACL|nr:Gfo/Idh/MocA family oxidoreductase [Paenibacillus wynnii]KGE17129.1 oxidoreductase [Paenibacillus wynnii]